MNHLNREVVILMVMDRGTNHPNQLMTIRNLHNIPLEVIIMDLTNHLKGKAILAILMGQVQMGTIPNRAIQIIVVRVMDIQHLN